jgi:hypothetical protein
VWRRIRQKHRDLYRVSNLLQLYRRTGFRHSRLSMVRLMAQLALANLVSDAWHNRIMTFVRQSRMSIAPKTS